MATIANISVVLIDNNWNGFGLSATLWTVIMILIAAILGIIMTMQNEMKLHTRWSLFGSLGIYNNNSGDSMVTTSALVASILLFAAIIVIRLVLKRSKLLAHYD